jgi:hypothetical protein
VILKPQANSKTILSAKIKTQMPNHKPRKIGLGQIAQYDKILQENIEVALPGLIKKVLKINAVKSEELPDTLQHTKERKPDVLKKITDTKGEVFVLHIEFQTKDEPDMVYRMAEYLVMLARKYRMAVKQFVLFIGEGIPTMVDNLALGKSYFAYQLISISTIDYRVFLRAEKPEEKMFAILADFGDDEPKKVITKIAESIVQGSNGELEKQRRKSNFKYWRNCVP